MRNCCTVHVNKSKKVSSLFSQTVHLNDISYPFCLWIRVKICFFTCWVLAWTVRKLPYLAFLKNRSHCITWVSRYCLCNKYTTLLHYTVWVVCLNVVEPYGPLGYHCFHYRLHKSLLVHLTTDSILWNNQQMQP